MGGVRQFRLPRRGARNPPREGCTHWVALWMVERIAGPGIYAFGTSSNTTSFIHGTSTSTTRDNNNNNSNNNNNNNNNYDNNNNNNNNNHNHTNHNHTNNNNRICTWTCT